MHSCIHSDLVSTWPKRCLVSVDTTHSKRLKLDTDSDDENEDDEDISLNDLPNEVLLTIFYNLSVKARHMSERVCRRWFNLMPFTNLNMAIRANINQQESLRINETFACLKQKLDRFQDTKQRRQISWKSLQLSSSNGKMLHLTNSFMEVLSRSSSAKHLSCLHLCDIIMDNALFSSVLCTLKNVRSLKLLNCYNKKPRQPIIPAFMPNFADCLPKLQCLHSQHWCPQNVPSTLNEFNFFVRFGLAQERMVPFAKLLSAGLLTRLCLTVSNHNAIDWTRWNAALQPLNNLKHLTIRDSCTPTYRFYVSLIAAAPNLEELSYGVYPRIEWEPLQMLPTLSTIKSLEFRDHTSLGLICHILSASPNVCRLNVDIVYPFHCTAENVKLIKPLYFLTELRFSTTSDQSASEFLCAIKSPDLTKLTLSMGGLSSLSIILISNLFVKMTELTITRCVGESTYSAVNVLTGHTLKMVFDHCSNLQTLNIHCDIKQRDLKDVCCTLACAPEHLSAIIFNNVATSRKHLDTLLKVLQAREKRGEKRRSRNIIIHHKRYRHTTKEHISDYCARLERFGFILSW